MNTKNLIAWTLVLVAIIAVATFSFNLARQTDFQQGQLDEVQGAPQSDSRLSAYRPKDFGPSKPSERIRLENGSTFNLEATIVEKKIGGITNYLYGYNSQIPGPTLEVNQGDKIYVEFTNRLDQPTTVHWHGLRLKNAFDGVPDVTQEEVKPGGRFRYEVDFPDEGIYWYPPHVREELQQERGLYGTILVRPNNASYFNEVNREEVLVLDDMLQNLGELHPFPENVTDFAMMGRYGNQMLINAETSYNLSVKKGDVLRLYLLNAANVRPFKFAIQDTKLKVVGGDSGKYEREYVADDLTITPSERYIVEVKFDRPGTYKLLNRNPIKEYVLGEIQVSSVETQNVLAFDEPKENPEITHGMDAYRKYFDKPVDFDYVLTIDIPGAVPMGMMMQHNDDGIEWEDAMFGMNRVSTSDRLTWIIRDTKTGKENEEATNRIPRGKVFKVRFENDADSLHPMQHQIHLHGARFLVLDADEKKNENLVWKDTVLLPVGASAELLTYFPNEGEWMLHCHTAEHLSAGMMTSITAT